MASLDRLRAWLEVAREPAVLRQALLTAVLVGTILMAVNHSDELVKGRLSPGLGLEIGLTYLVPFLVSAASSATALRRQSRLDRRD